MSNPLLRTVTVLEQSTLAIVPGGEGLRGQDSQHNNGTITERDAEILFANYPGTCQRFLRGLNLSQYCGIIRLDSCILEILPKIGLSKYPDTEETNLARRALLIMLRNAGQIEIKSLQSVQQGRFQAPLLDLFIEAFLQSALNVARSSLLTRYVGHIDSLPVVRGRIDVQKQLRDNPINPHLLHCHYDDFTADNPYNQAVLATVVFCRRWIQRSGTLRLWSETYSRFARVTLVSKNLAKITKLPIDRTTHSYGPVLLWCEWILKALSPSLASGQAEAPGLLFDMNKLFEDHVRVVEMRSLGNEHKLKCQGPKVALAATERSGVFHLKPDLTVWQTGKQGTMDSMRRIVDAKRKSIEPAREDWGVEEADIYQMLAYAIRYECNCVELVYPSHMDYRLPLHRPYFESKLQNVATK